MRDRLAIPVAIIAAHLVIGCGEPPAIAREPGEPLPDLTEAEMGRFLLGKAVFSRITSEEEGLGPSFNQTRCSDCHTRPVAGGWGTMDATLRKARRWENEQCDLLEAEGGDLIQKRATEALAATGFTGEYDPPDASAVVELQALSTFGMGLIEAVPEEDIIAAADPEDADGDGISGRVGRDLDGRISRFTGKAEWFSLYDFIDGALRTELGLTTPDYPTEETLNGVPVPPATDPMPEPEIDEHGINLLVDFVRYLAPPARAAIDGPALADSVRAGELLFESVGCAACHTPTLHTGPSESKALDRKPVNAYTDLLLHDLGPEAAGTCGLSASPSEYRTAKLWGLRFKGRYMYDGRAVTLDESIEAHGGEAAATRDAFRRLTPEERAELIRFLSIL
ncbi:MAG: di-heme oxidoredictase family protein [Gemmatimonadota bacterium]|jgi:CxxC motif-containing protein (DUF1111 family)